MAEVSGQAALNSARAMSLWHSRELEEARIEGADKERRKWLEWLARSHYGVDIRTDLDPPCDGLEYARVCCEVDESIYGSDPSDCLWGIQMETGAFLDE